MYGTNPVHLTQQQPLVRKGVLESVTGLRKHEPWTRQSKTRVWQENHKIRTLGHSDMTRINKLTWYFTLQHKLVIFHHCDNTPADSHTPHRKFYRHLRQSNTATTQWFILHQSTTQQHTSHIIL